MVGEWSCDYARRGSRDGGTLVAILRVARRDLPAIKAVILLFIWCSYS